MSNSVKLLDLHNKNTTDNFLNVVERENGLYIISLL